MSKFIPPNKVQQEQVMQSLRLIRGLKTGDYVRCKVGSRVGTTLRTKAERMGWTILSEDEFQEALKPQSKEPKND